MEEHALQWHRRETPESLEAASYLPVLLGETTGQEVAAQ